MPLTPAVITFYSFKGGVGRTMALLNLGYVLAARGRNVLLVDMDLEAPGMLGLLLRLDELEKPSVMDVVDLVSWARDISVSEPKRSQDADWVGAHGPNLHNYITKVKAEKLEPIRPKLGRIGNLHVIGIHEEGDYSDRFKALNLAGLDAEGLIRTSNVIRFLLKHHRIEVPVPEYYGIGPHERVPYDYILVDSRTGLTELGGLCIGPLADRLVVLCGLNHQNISGTRHALAEFGISGPSNPDKPWDEHVPAPGDRVAPSLLGSKPTVLVASLLPDQEIELRRQRLAELERIFGVKVGAQLSYSARMALLETIFVRDIPEQQLTGDYWKLANLIMALVGDNPRQLVTRTTTDDPQQGKTRLESAVRLALATKEDGQLVLRAVADRLTLPFSSDAEYMWADRLFSLLSQDGAQKPWIGFFKWASVLAEWNEKASTMEIARQRRQAALERIHSALKFPGASEEARASLHRLRGQLLLDDQLWLEGIESLTETLRLNPSLERRPILLLRAEACRQLKRWEEASADYGELLNSSNLSPRERAAALLGRGTVNAEKNQTADALKNFEEVLTLSEISEHDRASAYLARAMLHERAGDNIQALADYSAALDSTDEHWLNRAGALVNRGDLYRKEGKFTEAVADQTEVIKRYPSQNSVHRMALVNRGIAYLGAKQFNDAIADASAALDYAKDRKDEDGLNCYSYYIFAIAADAVGDFETTQLRLTQLRDSVKPPHELYMRALADIGWSAFKSGDYVRSIEFSKQALAISSSQAELFIQANLALALLHAGQFQESKREYARFLDDCTLQDVEIAIKDLDEALLGRPDLPGSQEIREQLTYRQKQLSLTDDAPSQGG